MHGFDRIMSLCGIGCKMLWTPWSQQENYDSVNKEDNDVTDAPDTVTSEPTKPIWTNNIGAPIVRNKSGSLANIKASLAYEKLPGAPIRHSASLAVLNEKRTSKSNPSGFGIGPKTGKPLLSESKDLNGSRASLADEILQVREMVTTV